MIEEPNKEDRRFSLKPVITPLPSQVEKERAASDSDRARVRKQASGDRAATREAQMRDITEDDDGYHPYADVLDTRPLFEEDPWR